MSDRPTILLAADPASPLLAAGVAGAMPPLMHRGEVSQTWKRSKPYNCDATALVLALAGSAVPEGMDRAARVLAAACGLAVGATAPEWRCYDDPNGRWWRIKGHDGQVVFFVSESSPGLEATRTGSRIVLVTGISTLTNTAHALALACASRLPNTRAIVLGGDSNG